MKIALWGCGAYGRTLYSLIRKYSSEAEITRVYDRKLAGKMIGEVPVYDPATVAADRKEGLFESMMITVQQEGSYRQIRKELEEQAIPLYTPGREEDMKEAALFPQAAADLQIGQAGYALYTLRDLRGMMISESSGIMYLFDENGFPLKEHWDAYGVTQPSTHRYDLPVTPRSRQPDVQHLAGSYCILTKLWAFNYSHFSFESLDCIQLLEEAGFTGYYVIPKKAPLEELLEIYGLPRERILTLADLIPGECYEFEKVFFPKLLENDRQHSAPVLKRAVKRIQQKLTLDPQRWPQRLYVRRIGSRKLMNGSELAKRYGMTEMIPEEHSLLEQMNYYYNAEVILSPHGANNANALYMREGSVLIETFGRNWVKYSYLPVLKEKKVFYLPVIEGPIMARFLPPDENEAKDYEIPQLHLDMAVEIADRLVGNIDKEK
ncbi:MAG: glycosyltransferase family 61 protein [Erysipelotrichaceae bacterium]|nr:glycosyltransferase family 61 protein [Erysipelotrichaceae bacterium]